jgi:hypothetical protein
VKRLTHTTIDVYDNIREGNLMMDENMFGNTMWAGHWLWMLVIAIVVVIPVWRICQRAGYSGWLGVLILIPMVNLALLYFIAFADWPANKTGAQNE